MTLGVVDEEALRRWAAANSYDAAAREAAARAWVARYEACYGTPEAHAAASAQRSARLERVLGVVTLAIVAAFVALLAAAAYTDWARVVWAFAKVALGAVACYALAIGVLLLVRRRPRRP